MARIVITSFGSYGDVFPYLGLGRGLAVRGHGVVMALPGFYRSMVEREGLEFRPVRPDVDPTDRETVRRIMDANTGTQFIVNELILPSLRQSYVDLSEATDGADLLITHPITFAGPVLAEKLHLPWVSTVLAPMSFFSPHDLPVFAPMPSMKRLERLPGAAAGLVRAARFVSRGWGEPVFELRRELGLPRGGEPVFEGQHSPYLVLAMFSRILARPQPDWPPNVRITGAITYDGPISPDGLSPRLQTFLDDGPPPIVFTLGSSAVGSAGRFYHDSVEAVRRIGARAVLLVGPHAENRPEGPLPDSVLLEPFARHSELFPQASVVVHQGGIGTLHQGLRAGRPTLVVPFAHDQPDNAYRAERLGVSRTLRAQRYSAGRAANLLRTLLEEPSFGKRAEHVAAEVRTEDGVSAACDAVESVLAGRAAGKRG